MRSMIGPTRTKIVCTLGPAVGTREKIRALMAAGSAQCWPNRISIIV